MSVDLSQRATRTRNRAPVRARPVLDSPTTLATAQLVAVVPDLFVDGIACKRIRVGVTSAGKPIYENQVMVINDRIPSLYWREGC
jgi:hypothetical protein